MTEPLAPAALRLRGSALIEASAGTGKTWTLAALMLRLVLGHGEVVMRGDRPLMPAEILVMTFTRAATRELRDRIRQRLTEAASVFRGTRPLPGDEVFLSELLQAYPDGPARELAAWRLESAAQGMDEAAIHTLDAWCQRMLREHALDGESPQDSEVLPDSHALRLEAARDVWRQSVYPLRGPVLQAITRLWSGPDDMARDAQLAAEKPLPALPRGSDFSQVVAHSLADLAPLKAGWGERADAMESWLMPQLERADTAYARNLISPDKLAAWMDALRTWADDPVAEQPDLSEATRRRLTPAGLLLAVKKAFVSTAPPAPEVFEAFEQLMIELAERRSRDPLLRAMAALQVEARLMELKRQRQLHSHADVQQALHSALDDPLDMEGSSRLRTRIVQQFPVALVDEFQDTSPLQLSILDRLYRIAENDAERCLLLIGDPKQSIYGFRGADIHSYLQARQATAGRHYALGVNHRSTHAVVEAVNHLFGAAEARSSEGAFRFGTVAGDGGPRLPFQPTEARGRAQALVASGQSVPALTLCLDADLTGATEARQRMADRCAQVLVEWLSPGRTALVEPGTGEQPLRPGDVAVLVRSHAEAALVRRAMSARGLPSVFLSDRDSVLETPEARDLLRVLQAVAAPRDTRRMRDALACDLLGFSLAYLRQIADDDDGFEAEAGRLAALGTIWHGQGLVALVRALLHEFGLPARWLQTPDGERRLTHVLHLSELVQQSVLPRDQPSAQLRWLAQQVEDPLADGAAGEDRVLRLESDADRVQVVTVHKSKGLEYPVVFLPFATQVRGSVGPRPWALWLVDDDGRRRVALDPSAEDRVQAEREQQREDVRLLYVALTRARHALWVGASVHTVGQSKDNVWHRSAWGALLTGSEPQAPEAIVSAAQGLAERCSAVRVQVMTPAGDPARQPLQRWAGGCEPLPLKSLQPYTAAFDRQWAISSYSSLVRDAAGAAWSPPVPSAEAARSAPMDDAETVLWRASLLLRQDEPERLGLSDEQGDRDRRGAPWHRFPRGAMAGNFLHAQLEWLADEGFGLHDNPALQQALVRRCERQAWGHRADDVVTWLARVCHQPLPPLRAPLQALQLRLPELEFWLPGTGLSAAGLDDACRRAWFPGQNRPALVQRTLRGLLMGFADLVFEHQGRYWVLDYKSNALGEDDLAYTPAAMQAAVLEHRYDVQAALYLLPLHRLLRARLGAAYRPEQHLGGAIYFFLRGVEAPSAGCLLLPASTALLDEVESMMAGSGLGDEAAA